jgi:hypothetical protein
MAVPVLHVEVVIAFRMIHLLVLNPQYVDEVGQVLSMRVHVDHADELAVVVIVGQTLRDGRRTTLTKDLLRYRIDGGRINQAFFDPDSPRRSQTARDLRYSTGSAPSRTRICDPP